MALTAFAGDAGADTAQARSIAERGWQLVWSDEFDKDALDASRWEAEASCWGGGNDERQCYTPRPENVRVADGVLRLTARRERFEGPLYPPGHTARGGPKDGVRRQDYTSGKVRTRGLAEWRYGRFEARMRLPRGQGAWSAFWMMPAGDVYGTWPTSGEIDIMESVNLGALCAECEGGHGENRTSGAIHFGEHHPNNRFLVKHTRLPGAAPPGESWHVFAVEWAEGVIDWYVDDRRFWRATSADWRNGAIAPDAAAAAPFNQPFYLMLNLAVGGRLPEGRNERRFDPSTFPAVLLVDWVRVHRCASDPETGRACMRT
jgi:beta-glucanase (GH16 family)